MEIIPAIIPKTYDDLCSHLARVKGVSRWVQIDVCDGVFAGKVSWPYNDLEHFAKIAEQEEGLPYWEDFEFEIDLMVANPVAEVDVWITAGASRVIVHATSLKNQQGIDTKEVVAQWRERVEVVAALGIEDSIEDVEAVFGTVDGIQCMGIARIGYQGEAFDQRVLTKIEALKTRYPEVLISVDGGMTHETMFDVADAGATRFVVGSFIFGSGDAVENFQYLTSLELKA